MPTPSEQLRARVEALRTRLCEQAERVDDMLSDAFEALHARDAERAAAVLKADDRVDAEDVAIEREAVDAMLEAMRQGCQGVDEAQARALLVIVKINNELERVGDGACAIADRVRAIGSPDESLPPAVRVLTNSVLGVLQDSTRALRGADPQAARTALRSEATVLGFRRHLVRESEQRVAAGTTSVDVAFDLGEIAHIAVTVADHCTNVCEQIIYETTGQIVRHIETGWIDLPEPRPEPGE